MFFFSNDFGLFGVMISVIALRFFLGDILVTARFSNAFLQLKRVSLLVGIDKYYNNFNKLCLGLDLHLQTDVQSFGNTLKKNCCHFSRWKMNSSVPVKGHRWNPVHSSRKASNKCYPVTSCAKSGIFLPRDSFYAP